jgi:protein-L-isoaspartate(D-aspartate) O-methyltransferase
MENKAWKQLIQSLISQRILRSPQVIRALRNVSREQFLPERLKAYANVDSPFPIGFGQTISAPHC